jgi:hypothetical protein
MQISMMSPHLFLVAILSFGLAYAQAQREPTLAETYVVMKAGRIVLTVTNRPGPLVSTALLPACGKPVMHPFLSARAHVPEEEDVLLMILEQSANFHDFLDRLRKAGYALRKISPDEPRH